MKTDGTESRAKTKRPTKRLTYDSLIQGKEEGSVDQDGLNRGEKKWSDLDIF